MGGFSNICSLCNDFQYFWAKFCCDLCSASQRGNRKKKKKLTPNHQYIMIHLRSRISSLSPNASISPYTCFIPLHVIIKAFGVLQHISRFCSNERRSAHKLNNSGALSLLQPDLFTSSVKPTWMIITLAKAISPQHFGVMMHHLSRRLDNKLHAVLFPRVPDRCSLSYLLTIKRQNDICNKSQVFVQYLAATFYLLNKYSC